MEDGRTFVYTNVFGGDWVADPKDPFGLGGRAQEWSKRIGSTEQWIWGTDIARGVNLGYAFPHPSCDIYRLCVVRQWMVG
jgi:hypothetical protein